MADFRLAIYRVAGSSFTRDAGGVSITELLVSVLVMGIAVAGVSEAAWLNCAWMNLTQHKMDNQYSCRIFLAQLAHELSEAVSIVEGSSGDKLEFRVLGSNGQESLIRYSFDAASNTISKSVSGAASKVVLSGVVGPIWAGTAAPSIFKYVLSSDATSSYVDKNVLNNSGAYIVLVVVDLDLMSNNVTGNRGAFGGALAAKSAYSVHREIFVKNFDNYAGGYALYVP
jgi:hypothetical protein